MPDRMHTLDAAFPDFNGMENTEEKLNAIQNYLFMLMEELRYLLRHLDADNFNDAGLAELAGRLAEAEKTEGEGALSQLAAEAMANGLLSNDEALFDRLSTSRRIRKYIMGDVSDDDFIRIRDRALSFISGNTGLAVCLLTEEGTPLLTEDGGRFTAEENSLGREQVYDRWGRRLYWQREPVSHSADGWPLDKGGSPVWASTAATPWPVNAYPYAERELARFDLRQSGEERFPQLVLGPGDGNGRDRGLLSKIDGGLLLRYRTASGGDTDIRLTDYVDAKHRRLASCAVDRSRGTVTYTVEGDETAHTLFFIDTGSGVRYTWPDGHICEVSIE